MSGGNKAEQVAQYIENRKDRLVVAQTQIYGGFTSELQVCDLVANKFLKLVEESFKAFNIKQHETESICMMFRIALISWQLMSIHSLWIQCTRTVLLAWLLQ
jgi:hypothetical protein